MAVCKQSIRSKSITCEIFYYKCYYKIHYNFGKKVEFIRGYAQMKIGHSPKNVVEHLITVYNGLHKIALISPSLYHVQLGPPATCRNVMALSKTLLSSHPELQPFHPIRSSDANSLIAILESGMMVEIAQFTKTENNISPIINALRH